MLPNSHQQNLFSYNPSNLLLQRLRQYVTLSAGKFVLDYSLSFFPKLCMHFKSQSP